MFKTPYKTSTSLVNLQIFSNWQFIKYEKKKMKRNLLINCIIHFFVIHDKTEWPFDLKTWKSHRFFRSQGKFWNRLISFVSWQKIRNKIWTATRDENMCIFSFCILQVFFYNQGKNDMLAWKTCKFCDHLVKGKVYFHWKKYFFITTNYVTYAFFSFQMNLSIFENPYEFFQFFFSFFKNIVF